MMEVMDVNGYYLPDGFNPGPLTFRTEEFQRNNVTVRLEIPTVTRAFVEVLAD
ncbi:MAG: hypothetical protein GY849_04060, partial [Deltaproteobacteria bacterium]|nr:hypothetical protein [Deltaproteobacteria bacterium]